MFSTPVPATVAFRSAIPEDCADLALLADMATRRLTSFLWGQVASPGQSSFEVGRNIIRNDTSHYMHQKNWRVAVDRGVLIGALNGYVIPEPTGSPPASEVIKPLNALKDVAAGTWYIAVASIYPEHQGKGLGKSLLSEAENIARSAGKDRLTLMVGSFNARAYGLYAKSGFTEWERRPFHPFPGSDEPGEWILMVKDL
ncbi:MAG: GNAT family N-acetyltransferase [Bosea sp.]|nr:GNAT family N-acetyltransferase [Bosea sp. (in: a-proteobacteria)]